MRTALVFGATGLVGGHCVKQLLAEERYSKIIVYTRRPLALAHPKLEVRRIDFAQLAQWGDGVQGDDVFCALGTTLRQAGSRERFRQVDHDLPIAIAELVVKHGARNWFMVSSVGASAQASGFYLRVKGETEEAMAKLPFESAHFFRPSLILGAREDRRPMEALAQKITPLLNGLLKGPLRKYRAIRAEAIAAQMIEAARAPGRGVQVHLCSERV